MKNKPVAVLAGVLAALVGAWVAHNAFNWIRGAKSVSPEVLTQAWSHQSLGAGADFVFDAPWTLEPTKLDLPPETLKQFTRFNAFSHEAQGLNVMASDLAVVPSISPSLEGAAEGAINSVKTQPTTASVEAKKQPTAVGGYPAMEIEATVRQKSGDPLHLHGLIVVRGSEMFQFLLIHREGQPLGVQAWNKARSSVRLAGAA
jgi:hypothetical protein